MKKIQVYGRTLNKATLKRLFIILLIITGCNSDSVEPILQDAMAGINFEKLQAGESFYYAGYQASCGSTFEFTGDTLQIEVIESNDSIYLKETFTAGSPSFGESFQHQIIPGSEYLLIPERFNSRLFNFYGNDSLFLKKQPNATLAQNGCKLYIGKELFTGEQIGKIENYKIGPIQISNKKGVSCVPVFLQMDGYLIYDQYLNLSQVVWEDGQVFGYFAISK